MTGEKEIFSSTVLGSEKREKEEQARAHSFFSSAGSVRVFRRHRRNAESRQLGKRLQASQHWSNFLSVPGGEKIHQPRIWPGLVLGVGLQQSTSGSANDSAAPAPSSRATEIFHLEPPPSRRANLEFANGTVFLAPPRHHLRRKGEDHQISITSKVDFFFLSLT